MTTCARLPPACWPSPRRSPWSGRSTTRTRSPRRSADLGEVRSTTRGSHVERRSTMIKVGVLGAKGRMGSEVSRDGRRRRRPGAGRRRRRRRRPRPAGRLRRGRGLHPPGRGHGQPAMVPVAWPQCRRRDLRVRRRPAGRGAGLARRGAVGPGADRAELLGRRRADDALRRSRRRRFFESAEVIELHHAAQGRRAVRDGDADRVADRRGPGRRRARAAPGRHGDRGRLAREARSLDGVRVHSVRLAGLLAHQEVLLGGHGEILTIRHDSLDRSSFMPGVLLAVRGIAVAAAGPDGRPDEGHARPGVKGEAGR